MKKILIICSGYLPALKFGGPPVSIENICALLNEEYQFYIITQDHDLGVVEKLSGIQDNWNFRDEANVLYLNDKQWTVSYIQTIMLQLQPDLIYLQSIFDYRRVLTGAIAAKKCRIPILLAPRGELCAGAMKKKYKKLPYLLFFRWLLSKHVFFQATSEEEKAAIKSWLHLPDNRIFFLDNIPAFPKDKLISKKSIKSAGSCKIIFISRIVPKKNLTFALNVLKNIKGEVTFDIYGAKEDLDYWKKCERLIENLPPNITVTYCGLVPHQDVNSILQGYDVLLFPTHSENYGHVIIESLFAGCPVIISDQTPWNDVNGTGAGWAIPLNKLSDFSNALQKVIDADSDRYRVNAKLFANKKLNVDILKKDYEAVFVKIQNR